MQLWVDFDVGWEVNDLYVDELEVGPGGRIRVVQIKRVRDVGVEDLG